jgi:hypothetical protein
VIPSGNSFVLVWGDCSIIHNERNASDIECRSRSVIAIVDHTTISLD